MPTDDGKDPAEKALGKKGGAARAKSMTSERRTEIAKADAQLPLHTPDEWVLQKV